MASTEKKVFVILSNQPYDSAGWTNKHYVSNELASRGHTVIFVDPPTRFKFLKSLFKKRKLELTRKEDENLYLYFPVNFLNFIPFSFLSNYLHSYIVKRLIKNNIKTKDSELVLWVYHFDFPQVFQFKKLLNPKIFLYDCVDSYEDFPEYSWEDITNKGLVSLIQKFDRFFKVRLDQKGLRGKAWVKYRENELAEKSDLMFTSHPSLYDKFKGLNKNTYYTPNAGRFDIYSKKPKSLPKALNTKKPRVLYSGALDNYKFDVDTFIHLANLTPDITYVLVGPIKLSDSSTKVDKLKSIKNVVLPGPVDKAELYAYYFDAYIIPYRLNEYVVKGCFPIKYFNALATGVPVVVSDLPCYRGNEDVTYIAKNKNDWVGKVQKAIKDTNVANKSKRIGRASKNTWKNKVTTQLKAIDSL